jgi:hypothetical protein
LAQGIALPQTPVETHCCTALPVHWVEPVTHPPPASPASRLASACSAPLPSPETLPSAVPVPVSSVASKPASWPLPPIPLSAPTLGPWVEVPFPLLHAAMVREANIVSDAHRTRLRFFKGSRQGRSPASFVRCTVGGSDPEGPLGPACAHELTMTQAATIATQSLQA